MTKYCAVSSKNECVLVHNTRRDNLLMFLITRCSQDELTYLNVPRIVQVFLPCPLSFGFSEYVGVVEVFDGKIETFHFHNGSKTSGGMEQFS